MNKVMEKIAAEIRPNFAIALLFGTLIVWMGYLFLEPGHAANLAMAMVGMICASTMEIIKTVKGGTDEDEAENPALKTALKTAVKKSAK